jgi:Domain of unknown function (DUF3846)
MATAIVIYRKKNEDGTDANEVCIRSEQTTNKPNLEELQRLVGGYIERVDTVVFPSKKRADVWVNEEGAINGENPIITCFFAHSSGRKMPLYGPVVFVRGGGILAEDVASICLIRSLDTTGNMDIPTLDIGIPAKLPQR